MIYETAIVVGADLDDSQVGKIKTNIADCLKEFKCEVLVNDDWGVKKFAQQTSKRVSHGRYIYMMFQTDSTDVNNELERRYRISEGVLKFIVVKLGADRFKDTIVKGYKNPNHGQDDSVSRFDAEKEKKGFSKRKSCYFSAKNTQPDWKDPSTYSWLVNEFGKISPARMTGLRPKYQRMATTAIKRGRCMGLISHMSGRTLR